MPTVCGNVPVREICITYSECDSYDGGETWVNCVDIFQDCYYEYDWRCYDVPDEPTDPTPDPDLGGGGGGGGNPLQIYNYLIDKEKCLNGLLDLEGDSYMQKLLANFDGVSKFNLKIASKDIVTTLENGIIKELNGKTSYVPGSNLITIEISTTRINNLSSLESARIILHEYVHADIFRKLNTQTETNQEILDFKNTYNNYENQHGIMAGLYINNMKETLKNFHKNVLKDDYNKYINYYGEVPSDAFYEALAWGGLKENNVKAWNDLPQEKKDSINSFSNRILILSKTNPCKQ